ncbi:hypothetical protein B0F90DRAFT_1711422 [Multifurca ochricompacta]|uniref:Uncharacterized protein n=1 Tax=Multifurca ochricompacta TaxID=376703 RepID=A0AAD4M895_9AGAM|nr:hypothetical protein B0F90DRAFT_1711422 [Multifurca ochricompacta]
MHRFRKWSDPRRSQLPESARSSTASSRTATQQSEPLPALPPVGDFRTSLILPGLSRRFTLLRAASGDLVSLDDLKNRFAEQRARGAENHLSEEEEEMFLQTLSRLRSRPSTSSTSGDSSHAPARESLRSGETTTSSTTSSPGSTKRYSNNMFGSGKFRDYTYLRSVAKERAGKGSAGRRSANSALFSTGSRSYKTLDVPTPEDPSQADPDDPSTLDSDTTPLASGVESSASELEQGIVKTFQPNHLRRASMALEEVIREIEDEVDGDGDGDGDDKILIPRSPAPERASSLKRRSVDKPRPIPMSESSVYKMGTALSPDPQTHTDAAEFRSTPSPYPRAETSPTPRLPGYIPGMPRPMTPREATYDPDEVPPATSPSITSNVLRRDSTSVRQSHRSSSPLTTSASAPIPSLLSGVNGRFTPDRSHTPDNPTVEFGNPLDSSLLGRRRPVSPFSSGTYQSMTVSSRPSTPSSVTWKAPLAPGNGSTGGHSRSGSAVGFFESDLTTSGLPSQLRNGFDKPSSHTRNDSTMSSNDLHEVAQLNRSGSLLGNRSLRSPALPDSPVLENATQSVFTLPRRGQASPQNNDLSSSPLSNTALRSSTPTQYPPRSPASPAFSEHDVGRNSRRGSRQATASPFTRNHSQTMVLSPLANSSRSSLESAGSSYHTWEADKQDRTLPLLAALEPQPPAWHDISVSAGDPSPLADGDVEEIVQQHSGLGKGDFLAIQERLVFAARLKAEAPEQRERKSSLRKRRPSTSQSVNGQGRDNGAPDSNQQGSPLRAAPQDNTSKASALLDSVVDSIQAPPSKLSSTTIQLRTDTDVVAGSSAEPGPSSATRRKNALARALFGASDSEQSLTSPSPQPTDGPITGSGGLSRSLRETFNAGILTSSSSTTEPLDKQQELAREVQRRAEAAMAQLKKMPSNTKVNDGGPHRKRIDPSQISGPKLVSASTSVETIPVRSSSAASGQLSAAQAQSPNSSKLGTRFKKLRGSLRAKPISPLGDGLTIHSLDLPSANPERSSAGTPDGPPPFSAIEPQRPKTIVPSPPATAGPGFKGFVSRLLKQRSGETPELERRKQLPSASASTSSSLATPSYFAQQQAERHLRLVLPEASAVRAVDENALKQFIDAANNLGLDQDALTEFLARSTSISSRITAQGSKHTSAASSDRFGHDRSKPAPLFTGGSSARRHIRLPSPRSSSEVIGKPPVRRPLAHNTPPSDPANAAVVRRTLILPSEAKLPVSEPGAALRKSSSTRRRRSASAASVHSNRSLHDRVPTPPPPKSPTGQRFSAEQSPPLPHIPTSLLSQTEAMGNALQSAPAIPLEKSNSAYDSL